MALIKCKDAENGKKVVIKDFTFKIEKCEIKGEDGEKRGIVSGYASTFGNIDRVGDIIADTAFDRTIQDHKNRHNRPIRMYFNHNRNMVLGSIPIDKVRVDSRGLFIEANINLETQLGRETYELLKAGDLSDFSIGFHEIEFSFNFETGINTILEIELLEISVVTEPANQEAMVTDIKSRLPFLDLPLAERDHKWNPEEAEVRVREFCDASNIKNAYLWAGDVESLKFPIADVVDGELKVIPLALFEASAALRGLAKEVEVPRYVLGGIADNIKQYYSKMDLDSPFTKELTITALDVETLSKMVDVENLLANVGFTKQARKNLISQIKTLGGGRDDETHKDGLNDEDMETLKESLERTTEILN